MITAIGITLLVGLAFGVVLGVPLGRTLERVRPRSDGKTKTKKSSRDRKPR